MADYAAIADNFVCTTMSGHRRLHTGWLHMKQRSFLSGWKRRFCVLKRDRDGAYVYLHVYKGSNTVNEPLLESIAIRQIKTHVLHASSKTPFVLEVLPYVSATALFACSDERVFRDWETQCDAAGIDMVVRVTSSASVSTSSNDTDVVEKEPGLFERLGKAYMKTFLMDAATANDIVVSKRLLSHHNTSIERKIEARLQQWFVGAADCGRCSVNGMDVAGPGALPQQVTLHMVSPGGWKWCVTEVYTTLPRTTFRWRQVGYFHGTFQGVAGNGDMIELEGFCHMDFDAASKKPTHLQLFYSVDGLLAALYAFVREKNLATAV
ncbi:hypothetical protein SDRG_11246 [Saprolegnia diclina VS20]|uniref:PH domain-containing protein n=1 Tax=Saprolegnia diclina (strain VS20) TaxID=1156394 RepID=T0QBZ7_SAPDV|nr:hypothetical protein SDRG_11246 [Saprolegnia diclina VS20]EQC31060.1 hypothetical protein SDRG_11246 [Saprolegnia diclina VS20]|eukprot:XP_008615499.1 hypothetical protein SDRG_11246 [Saprolegnia diclina VS20]